MIFDYIAIFPPANRSDAAFLTAAPTRSISGEDDATDSLSQMASGIGSNLPDRENVPPPTNERSFDWTRTPNKDRCRRSTNRTNFRTDLTNLHGFLREVAVVAAAAAEQCGMEMQRAAMAESRWSMKELSSKES